LALAIAFRGLSAVTVACSFVIHGASLQAMTVHAGPYEFDQVSYDGTGDVLYLTRGPRQAAATTVGTPEGHAVRLDDDGEVIGITIVNAKWLLDRDGKITVGTPKLIEPNAAELAQALAA
jgi:uncharacterized protein YuzE